MFCVSASKASIFTGASFVKVMVSLLPIEPTAAQSEPLKWSNALAKSTVTPEDDPVHSVFSLYTTSSVMIKPGSVAPAGISTCVNSIWLNGSAAGFNGFSAGMPSTTVTSSSLSTTMISIRGSSGSAALRVISVDGDIYRTPLI